MCNNTFDRIYLDVCPICFSKKLTMIGKKTGKFVKEDFSVGRCAECDCVYVLDPIHPKHLEKIYNKEYFFGIGMDDTVNYVENLERQNYFFEKYDWQIGTELSQYNIKQTFNWLDIGCAVGNVLDWAHDRYGVKTYGIEFSDFARDIASERKHKVIGKTINDIKLTRYENTFDIISCYEALEHLYNVNEVIERISKLLKKGGVFHYKTGAPPENSRILEWEYLRPEVHIIFYSVKCMTFLINKHGLLPNLRKRSKVKMTNFRYFKIPPLAILKNNLRCAFPFILNRLRPMQPDAIKV